MTALGLLAGLLTTVCWVPQLRQTWRTRSTDDLAWTYLVVLTIGIALWLLYGIAKKDPTIIGANGFALASLLFLSWLKANGRPANGRPAPAGQPRSPVAGRPGTGSAEQPGAGSSGQPGAGSAGQPGAGSAGQPAAVPAGQPVAVSGDRPAALLLDMDGTLIDSHAPVARSWQHFSSEYGVDHDTVMRVHPGRPAASTIKLVAPWLDDESANAAAAAHLAREYEDLEGVVPAPGAHRLLAELDSAGVPWAVVTSADRRLASARLSAVGVAPPLLITSEDVTRGKPHPDGYLLAAQRLGVPAERCLVVEDAPVGVQAGRSAGMRVVRVGDVQADFAVCTLSDLADVLRAVPSDAVPTDAVPEDQAATATCSVSCMSTSL